MAISRLQKLFGVGPAGAVICLGWLMIAAGVDRVLGDSKILAHPAPVQVVGGALAALGLGLLFWSSWTLRNWWAKEDLCTLGPFKWLRHPMYAAWITLILPAGTLYLNSWIMLLFVALLHPLFHLLVIREEKMMSEIFGDRYQAYAARTGRFFPRLRGR